MINNVYETATSDYYPNNLEYYDYIYLDHLKYSKELLNELIPVFKKYEIKTVLDACCGSGNDIVQLQMNNFFVNASDLCQKMIDFTKNRLTKRNIESASFFLSNVLNLNTTCSIKFDLVLFRGNTLGHLTSAEQLKAIDELINVANPNGLILIDFRNGLEYFNKKRLFEQRGFGVDRNLSNLFFSFYKIRHPKLISNPYIIKSFLYVLNYRTLKFYKYINKIEAHYVIKDNIIQHLSKLGLKYQIIRLNQKGLPNLETMLIFKTNY